MKDRSLNLSFSRVKKVHGVEIKKMKCGEFIAAMEELKDLPARVVDKLFNGDVDAAIDQLKHMDKQRLFELLGRLLFLLPEEIIGAVNYLLGIPREQIEELTPSQLLEIVETWYDVNDVSDFFATARRLKVKVARGFGFSDGSQSEKASD